MKRQKRGSDYSEPSWWTSDHGGLPGWAIVITLAVIAALGVVVVVLALNPR